MMMILVLAAAAAFDDPNRAALAATPAPAQTLGDRLRALSSDEKQVHTDCVAADNRAAIATAATATAAADAVAADAIKARIVVCLEKLESAKAAGATFDPYRDSLVPYQVEIVECVAARAVELGAGNREPASDVIEAANAACIGKWESAEAAVLWDGMVGRLNEQKGRAHNYGREGREGIPTDSPRFRAYVQSEAFKALLAAREKARAGQ